MNLHWNLMWRMSKIESSNIFIMLNVYVGFCQQVSRKFSCFVVFQQFSQEWCELRWTASQCAKIHPTLTDGMDFAMYDWLETCILIL